MTTYAIKIDLSVEASSPEEAIAEALKRLNAQEDGWVEVHTTGEQDYLVDAPLPDQDLSQVREVA